MELREKIKALYGKSDIYVDMAVRFMIVFAALLLLKDRIGTFEILNNLFIIAVISLVCSMLPYGLIAAVLSVCLLLQSFGVSMLMTAVLAVLLLVIAVLYYSFEPGDSVVLILTPIMFALYIPYVLPVMVGLTCTPVSVIPLTFGIVVYYVLQYMMGNAGAMAGEELLDMARRLPDLLKNMTANKEMWLIAAIFAITVIVVYVLRRMSFNYSQYIAIAAGLVLLLILTFIGTVRFGTDVRLSRVLIQVLLSGVIAVIYNFFVFSVDYSRTERTQFQDDDYYYYVKAVPRNSVKMADSKVQTFSSGTRRQDGDARK